MEECLSDRENNLVSVYDACPLCGERDADHLLWDDNGERVTCYSCGKTYTPEV